LTGQCHFRSFVCHWQNGAGSRRIEAEGASKFWVPEIGGVLAIERAHPPSLDETHETVLAFDCGFVAMPSQDEDIGIARDGLRGRTPRHGNLGIAVHYVLVNRRHAWIRCLGTLRPALQLRGKS